MVEEPSPVSTQHERAKEEGDDEKPAADTCSYVNLVLTNQQLLIWLQYFTVQMCSKFGV
jgi:hypothetical protein